MQLQDDLLPPSSRLHALVVEDGAANRRLIRQLLLRSGCRVTLAENGWRAVVHLREEPFDFVLMDVDMPVMDGLTATRVVRAAEVIAGGRTPIIALTSDEISDACAAAGMDAFLSKPLHMPALHNVLTRLLSQNAA